MISAGQRNKKMTWKTGDADEFLEDIMTKHMCKFYVAYPVGGRDYRCKCGRAATPQEIVAKLNATERLSAERAGKMADEMEAEKRTSTTRHIRELRAYVSILEERNG